MLAVATIKGEKTPLAGGLIQITADAAEGKLYALFNSTSEHQFNVVWEFTDAKLTPLGDTKVDGSKYAISIYPGETKEFVSGKFKSVKKMMNFGAPDKAWQDKKAQEVDRSVETEINTVKELLQKNPRADKKYSAEYVAGICERNSVPFVDITFLPRSSSLARDFEGKAASYMWMRPSTYCKEPPCLFVNTIEPNDIDQGNLGDCYLMCAMACASEFPALIQDVFAPPQNPAIGVYRVRICKNGWWQVCTVDDLFPINPVTRKPAYAKNREEPHELWVSIIEKAYAKLFGSYAAIRSGDPAQALGDILGYPYEKFSQIQAWAEDKDSFFDYLLECNAGGCVVALGTPGAEGAAGSGAAAVAQLPESEKQAQAERYKAVGLSVNHAYSLLKVKVLSTGERLCQIRNPWGNEIEWNGAWGDKSGNWTQESMSEVEFTQADDGTFWMAWDDVVKYFDSGCIGYVQPTFTQCRIAGNFDLGVPDVVLKLELRDTTRLWFGCHQRDSRGLVSGDRDQKYCGVQVSILQDKAPNKSVSIAVNGNGSYQASRDTFGRAELPANGEPYYILVQAFQEVSKSFVLSLLIEDPDTIARASFVSYAENSPSKKRYNPATVFNSSMAPVKVSAQYQILTPNHKLPVELTGDSVVFKPSAPKANPVAPPVDMEKLAAVAASTATSQRRYKLSATVVGGKNLVAKDVGGTSDPYVTICLYDAAGKKYPDVPEVSTRFIKNTLNPVWGEKFVFSVLPTDILYVECWDKDVFGRDPMGNCRFAVQSLGLQPAAEAKREIKALKGGDATGELEFLFTLS